jgi:hypothetical protein
MARLLSFISITVAGDDPLWGRGARLALVVKATAGDGKPIFDRKVDPHQAKGDEPWQRTA